MSSDIFQPSLAFNRQNVLLSLSQYSMVDFYSICSQQLLYKSLQLSDGPRYYVDTQSRIISLIYVY